MKEIATKQHYLIKKNKKLVFLKRIRFVLILVLLMFASVYFKNSFVTEKLYSNISTENLNTEPLSVNTKTLPVSGSAITYKDNTKINDNDNNKIKHLKEDLQKYISNFEGQYGIYYYNLNTHEEFGINGEDQYIAASTIKIPLNLYLYTLISSGKVNPNGALPYLEEDYEEGTGNIQFENFEKTYTIEELSRRSIINSDNVAANILFRFLGKWNVKDFMGQVGGKVINDFQNVSSPKDMGLYMNLVYEFYLKDASYGKQLMDSFLNTEFNDRLPAALPQTTKVAHKIGTQDGVSNDVGIVFINEPYIISVMSKDINEDEASGVIAEISKKIFLYVKAKGSTTAIDAKVATGVTDSANVQ